MKRLICLMICLMMAVPALAEETADAQFADVFKRHSVTGAAVVVARGEEIIYEYYYGWSDRKAKEKVTPETYFLTASVTKLISGVHIMQLVEQGKLDLDASIGDYLGYPVYNPYAQDTPVTLRHLMTHTSSLRSDRGYARAGSTLKEMFGTTKALRNNFYQEKPGSKYRYSNFGAGIMGSLMECVTGKTIQETVEEGLFTPMGIDAGYHVKFLDDLDMVSAQHSKAGDVTTAASRMMRRDWDDEPAPDRHLRITVGSVWIRPTDLCRIGIMLCQGGQIGGKTILQPETVEAMCADQKGQGYVTISSPYGLCVNRVENLIEGKMFYGHQGMITDLVCNLYFDPETELVFVLMTSGTSAMLKDRIAGVSRRTFEVAWNTFGE